MYAREFGRYKKAFLIGTVISTLLLAAARVMQGVEGLAELVPEWVPEGETLLFAVQGAFVVWGALFACYLGGTVMHSDWEKGLLERYCSLPITRGELVRSRFVPGIATACLTVFIPAIISKILCVIFMGWNGISAIYPVIGILITVSGTYALCFLSGSIFKSRTSNTVVCVCVFMGVLWMIWQGNAHPASTAECIKLLLYDRANVDAVNVFRACAPALFALVSLPVDILIWKNRDI